MSIAWFILFILSGITTDTLQEPHFHWNLNFAISLMANSLNLNSAYNYVFRNLSMIAYMIEFQNQNSLIFLSLKLTSLSQVAKLNAVYIFIL